jgi:N-acetylglucosaminyl-diphospho-decaprenol L-rhamnosyltransferase
VISSIPPTPPPGEPRTADVTAVLVNHDSGGRLPALLDVLDGSVRSVVVVDNASSDGSAEAVADRPRVTLVRNADNRGFAAAANQGAALARTEWLLFVNPDTRFAPGDPARLVLGLDDRVASAAALQVDQQGRPRAETAGYEPTLGRYLVWAVVPARRYRTFGPWLAPPFPDEDFAVDWASGAFVAIRRVVFERLGGFDERFFLYHEDVDFGRRVRRAGFRVIVRPSVPVYHEVAHGAPARRIASGLRSIESLSLDFEGARLRGLGAVLGLGYGLRAILGRETTRQMARAVLPYCRSLIAGRRPMRPPL